MSTIITLTTDFGTSDGFVGAMKGVILSRCGAVCLVDITHEIPPFDIRGGAVVIREATPFYPPGTIHLGVVDPGVGTSRTPILIFDGIHFYLGPDNGLFSLVIAGKPKVSCWHLTRKEFHRASVSQTFHGRDIFAEVAGYLACGVKPEELGIPLDSWVTLPMEHPRRKGTRVEGHIINQDGFGNLITNITHEWVPKNKRCTVQLGGIKMGPIRKTFGDVSPGEWVAYWGSGGYLELAIREGHAAKELKTTASTVLLEIDGDSPD